MGRDDLPNMASLALTRQDGGWTKFVLSSPAYCAVGMDLHNSFETYMWNE